MIFTCICVLKTIVFNIKKNVYEINLIPYSVELRNDVYALLSHQVEYV